jgi:hypothetical protein
VGYLRRCQLTAVLGLTVVVLAISGVPARAAAGTIAPSLRMFGSARRVTVTQNQLRFGTADLGLWVGSVGGDFQINVRRPGYGAWTASQVDSATAARLRAIPAALLDPNKGLTSFFNVRFADSRGRTAARREVTFCPNGLASRVDDSGPVDSSYLNYCRGFGGFPFIRGEVWGINKGWAVTVALGRGAGFQLPFGFLPPGAFPAAVSPLSASGWVSLEPGVYTAIVTVTAEYRRLFRIAARQATTRVRMRVLFSPLPRARPPVGRASHPHKPEDAGDALAPLAARTTATPDPRSMPNLVAAPAWGIATRRAGRAVGPPIGVPASAAATAIDTRSKAARRPTRDLLTFNATIWNAGPAPFSIEGFRRPYSNLMHAYEYFFDAAGDVVGRAPAGTLVYDTRRGHNHWHLRQLASYQLVGAGRTIISQKQSFCVAPTDPVDLTMPGAQGAQVAAGFGGSVCDLFRPGAIWIREQLPAGWGDTYTQVAAGQAFDITDVPNGSYKILVRVNPLGVLHETSTSDDVAIRRIRLSGRRGARQVAVLPWRGIRG